MIFLEGQGVAQGTVSYIWWSSGSSKFLKGLFIYYCDSYSQPVVKCDNPRRRFGLCECFLVERGISSGKAKRSAGKCPRVTYTSSVQGQCLYIFKVFIECPLNLGSGCISVFSVNLTFDKSLMMQFCYFFLEKSPLFGL